MATRKSLVRRLSRAVFQDGYAICESGKPACRILLARVWLWLVGILPFAALASNGLNLIGYGAESVALGGADVAVAADTMALNTNPAGIAQLGPRSLDIYQAVAHALDVSHADGFGNDRAVSNHFIPLAGIGYVSRPTASRCAWGVAFFGQGGAGFVYNSLNTAFGTVDELSSLVRIVRLSPGIGCQTESGLHLGAALALNHADIRQKIFPATSAGPFFGSDLKGASGWGATVKMGILAPVSDRLTIGASFTPKVKLPLSGGRLVSNQTAAGRGLVTYRDIAIDGLVLPTEVSIGAAWRPVPNWLLSAEVTWLDWSKAATRSTLTARNPDNAAAPDINVASTLNWRDQVVLALGAAWNLDVRTTLYAGLNVARNPIPPTHLSPILAPVGERHLTFGIRRALDPEWSLTFAMEYQFRNIVTYSNPELPFGANAKERNESAAFHAVFGRRW